MICSKRDKRRSIYASPFIMKSHAWQAVSYVISDSLGLFLYQTTSDIIHVSHCSIHISFLFVFEKTDSIRQYKKTLAAFTGTVSYMKTRRYYTHTSQSRDAKYCVSQARMHNELMWIYACHSRYHSSEDARFCVHIGRTPIIHLRLIVSHSSFFRTAAAILYSSFSRCSPSHLQQMQNKIWLTAALNKNRSLITIRV